MSSAQQSAPASTTPPETIQRLQTSVQEAFAMLAGIAARNSSRISLTVHVMPHTWRHRCMSRRIAYPAFSTR